LLAATVLAGTDTPEAPKKQAAALLNDWLENGEAAEHVDEIWQIFLDAQKKRAAETALNAYVQASRMRDGNLRTVREYLVKASPGLASQLHKDVIQAKLRAIEDASAGLSATSRHVKKLDMPEVNIVAPKTDTKPERKLVGISDITLDGKPTRPNLTAGKAVEINVAQVKRPESAVISSVAVGVKSIGKSSSIKAPEIVLSANVPNRTSQTGHSSVDRVSVGVTAGKPTVMAQAAPAIAIKSGASVRRAEAIQGIELKSKTGGTPKPDLQSLDVKTTAGGTSQKHLKKASVVESVDIVADGKAVKSAAIGSGVELSVNNDVAKTDLNGKNEISSVNVSLGEQRHKPSDIKAPSVELSSSDVTAAARQTNKHITDSIDISSRERKRQGVEPAMPAPAVVPDIALTSAGNRVTVENTDTTQALNIVVPSKKQASFDVAASKVALTSQAASKSKRDDDAASSVDIKTPMVTATTAGAEGRSELGKSITIDASSLQANAGRAQAVADIGQLDSVSLQASGDARRNSMSKSLSAVKTVITSPSTDVRPKPEYAESVSIEAVAPKSKFTVQSDVNTARLSSPAVKPLKRVEGESVDLKAREKVDAILLEGLGDVELKTHSAGRIALADLAQNIDVVHDQNASARGRKLDSVGMQVNDLSSTAASRPKLSNMKKVSVKDRKLNDPVEVPSVAEIQMTKVARPSMDVSTTEVHAKPVSRSWTGQSSTVELSAQAVETTTADVKAVDVTAPAEKRGASIADASKVDLMVRSPEGQRNIDLPAVSVADRTETRKRFSILAAPVISSQGKGYSKRQAALDELLFKTNSKLAREYINAGRYAEARRLCLNLASNQPGSEFSRMSIRLLMDVCHEEMVSRSSSDLDAVISLFMEQIDEQSPIYEYALMYAGLFAYQSQAYRPAITRIDAYIKAYPDSEWLDEAALAKALSHMRLRENKDAMEGFRTLVTRFPDSSQTARAQFLIAWLYLSDYEIEDAKRELKVVIEKYPETEFAGKAKQLLARFGD